MQGTARPTFAFAFAVGRVTPVRAALCDRIPTAQRDLFDVHSGQPLNRPATLMHSEHA